MFDTDSEWGFFICLDNSLENHTTQQKPRKKYNYIPDPKMHSIRELDNEYENDDEPLQNIFAIDDTNKSKKIEIYLTLCLLASGITFTSILAYYNIL